MIGHALDDDNNLIIDQGKFKTIIEAEETEQSVGNDLLTYSSEWFADRSIGVPYFPIIFQKPFDAGETESIFKAVIVGNQGILELLKFRMFEPDTGTRKLKIDFAATTIYGEDITSGETINV